MTYAIKIQKTQPDDEMVKVVAWLRDEGDTVKQGAPLLIMETQKATVRLEAEVCGVLDKIIVPAGEWVAAPAVVGLITIQQ